MIPLWFDLETTGLDPRNGRIVEFAAALCEDPDDGLRVTRQFSSPIHYDISELMKVPRDRVVLAMHDASGLWLDVMHSTTTLAEVDAFLAGLSDGRPRSVMLCGNSPHFDLAWARVHLPAFAKCLHHQVFDLTSVRRAVDSWGASGIIWPERTHTHRALADVQEALADARVARDAMGGAP